jgi:NodT family efflux transporter outer membrane factor (OMF) lipoprotein
MKNTYRYLLLLSALMLAGCAAGPDYIRPAMDIPASYREPPEGWKAAQPSDDQLPEAWWTLYQDETLSRLIEAVSVDNQNLKATEARYRQAKATLAQARAGYFPNVGLDASSSRAQSSGTLPAGNQYQIGLSASWEIDIWGRVRRTVEAEAASLALSRAELEALRLSLQTSAAQTYIQLKVADLRAQSLRETVQAYQTSLEIAQNRYKAGVVTKSDVSQAQTQLESARAQLIDLSITRTQYHNALALLVGKFPAEFSLEVNEKMDLPLPIIPVTVPSTLLERRPDIAAAERAVEAANARIGVAQVAFYPSFSLSAAGGYRESHWSDWFNLPARFWSLGASLAQFIFDGGKREATVDAAKAAYDATVASYKETVLSAFGEVENNLTTLRVLDEEMRSQQAALLAAREAEALTINQYKAGTVTYTNVVMAQTARLNAEMNAIALRGRQLQASTALIGALGGHWDQGSFGKK